MSSYSEQVHKLLASMDDQENQAPQHTPQEKEAQTSQDQIQDVYVLIVREHGEIEEDQSTIVESAPTQAITHVESTPVPVTPTPTPAPAKGDKKDEAIAYAIMSISLLLLMSIILMQLYSLVNPPVATITIIPTSHTIMLNGTMQLGRVLPALTISQSQTTPATGHGHQIATAATGYITFYNGSNQAQTLTANTVLTGNDGIQVETNEAVTIPPNTPPVNGQATIAAQAINAGSTGNIRADDINLALTSDLTAKNLTAFRGGQDERTFTTVTQNDIHSISTVLKTTLAASMHGALEGQLRPQEQLYLLPCTPTDTSDHQPGAEATQVTVTVSETCSAVAYNSQELVTKATRYLATQAQSKLAGYSLFGDIQVAVKQATVNSTTPHLVFFSFHATGTWIYGISLQSQEQIKHLIAGTTTQQAQQLLGALPGVESATIHFSGFGDDARIPKTTGYIHLSLIVM